MFYTRVGATHRHHRGKAMKYDKNHALLSTEIPEISEPKRGKVRDVYDLGDSLLFVATDRISAFDCIMPNGIPAKARC